MCNSYAFSQKKSLRIAVKAILLHFSLNFFLFIPFACNWNPIFDFDCFHSIVGQSWGGVGGVGWGSLWSWGWVNPVLIAVVVVISVGKAPFLHWCCYWFEFWRSYNWSPFWRSFYADGGLWCSSYIFSERGFLIWFMFDLYQCWSYLVIVVEERNEVTCWGLFLVH